MAPEIAALKEALARDERVVLAIVFGSVARGEARPDSDVDLAMMWRDEHARAEAAAEGLTLFGRLALAAGGRDVHLVDLERSDSALCRRILAEGRILIDRAPARRTALWARTLREYFDWEYARQVIDSAQRRRLHPSSS